MKAKASKENVCGIWCVWRSTKLKSKPYVAAELKYVSGNSILLELFTEFVLYNMVIKDPAHIHSKCL